jgi:hypothetical protein
VEEKNIPKVINCLLLFVEAVKKTGFPIGLKKLNPISLNFTAEQLKVDE